MPVYPLRTKHKTDVRSGRININLSGGRFGYAAERGYNWESRMSSTIDYAVHMEFNATETLPSHDNFRWLGYSLRCISTV